MAEGISSDIRTYRDLHAWQRAVELAELVYRVTAHFPEEEKFGLVAQMRRPAVSVGANIAEGFGRGRQNEFLRFLEISRGSLFELQTHAELARRIEWLESQMLTELRESTHQTDAVLSGLLKSVKKRRT